MFTSRSPCTQMLGDVTYILGMLRILFGSPSAERVLLYLENYREGYAFAIARSFGLSLSQVQNQLKRLEAGGILVSTLKGKTRLYQFNPRYPFLKELRALLARMIEFMPEEERRRFFMERTRPRRAGKP
jgi:DNA-binding transcriptional ArsR family regulator